ncbi:LacI family DNA-binding transcriptional regulator [Streptomyces sp. TS71-3]|uniref:LacI family DNA-binding transcriptional regulator n=1 Tax=Streptomyces sp. TS71-3 TaxID=2733862 RepID=UPI001B095ADB|nr:LacI family DNA-binding transcriptional regulator [Streptomyces sp. TS71-3]GHJ38344.1 LacI family transcriptional regulator [Streptomyces sp. TS71-3]
MATMVDVARRAGVSVATVSHVLNRTRPVRPDTRRAVLEAVEELGYSHNALARSLVTARTRSVGLAVSAISNPYFTEILQGVEAAALEHGYGLLIADPHDDPVHERTVAQLLHERRVDGLIVAPSARPAALVGYVARHRVPTVFLDRMVSGDVAGTAPAADAGGGGRPEAAERPVPGEGGGHRFDQVCADGVVPTAWLTGHLAALGHRRIGLVAGFPGLSTSAERIAGYRAGLERAGLPADPALIADGHSEAEGAERATHALLSTAAAPSALVTANNAMTIGALRALRIRGLRVPDDIALACFDDFSWADLFAPRLTAVRQPSRELGARAMGLLLDRLAAPERPSRTVRLPCAVIHRTSCGCPEEAPRTEPAEPAPTAPCPHDPHGPHDPHDRRDPHDRPDPRDVCAQPVKGPES